MRTWTIWYQNQNQKPLAFLGTLPVKTCSVKSYILYYNFSVEISSLVCPFDQKLQQGFQMAIYSFHQSFYWFSDYLFFASIVRKLHTLFQERTRLVTKIVQRDNVSMSMSMSISVIVYLFNSANPRAFAAWVIALYGCC